MKRSSILNADFSEQRWVDQICKNFDDVDVSNVSVCVFNVPKSISNFKPDAYVPQAIALGPYHHFKTHLYQMERYKVASVKEFLNPNQILSFESLVIDRLKRKEPVIRACYHKYLDLDDDTLAWIVAIDGLFLLTLLRDYGDLERFMPKKLMHDAILYRDVLVLENQIPYVILNEIQKILHLSSDYHNGHRELFNMMRGFCEVHSPLKLAQEGSDYSVKNTNYLHLLDLMYHLIVNNKSTNHAPRTVSVSVSVLSEDADDTQKITKEEKDHAIENIEEAVEMGLKLGMGKRVNKPIKVIETIPWEKISNLLGLKMGDNLENFQDVDNQPLVTEIDIPSVSSLCKYGRINFSHTEGGIRDIKFAEKEATLYLPVITLDVHSEVVLRNLVAYEVATSNSSQELSQYVDLMSGIIDTEADAMLLKAKGIIKGNMTNKEIADLFNGMNKSNANASSNVTIERINAYYNNKPTIKAWRFVKRCTSDSRKILTVVLTIFVCLLMVLYSFCEVYGCTSFFNRTT